MPGGASALRDEVWENWTVNFGWPVQGIFRGTMDGSDINKVDRNRKGDLLAVADDFGKLVIYRYPCLDKGSQGLILRGHSSHVTNV